MGVFVREGDDEDENWVEDIKKDPNWFMPKPKQRSVTIMTSPDNQ